MNRRAFLKALAATAGAIATANIPVVSPQAKRIENWAVDRLVFFFSSGNIKSGRLFVYGLQDKDEL